MADLKALLAASQIGARAASAAPVYQSDPTDNTDLLSTLSEVGGAGLGAVASVGNFLDLPGSSVRDLLAGENPFDQWLTPLTDENRVSGRQLLERRLGMRKNRETGLAGWLSDPGEGLRDLAGFATEVALDPFGPLTKPVMAGTKVGKALAAAGSNAHPLLKQFGNGVTQVFDKLPARVQGGIFNTAGRGIKALFNAPTRGVTNAVIQPMAEAASKAAETIRFSAASHAIDVVTTAEKNGFSLTPDLSLDSKDLTTWSNPNSLLRVNSREQAIYRYLEGVYDPAEARIAPKDIVTIGDTPDLKEVEWINRTDRGVEVKLVGEDVTYPDSQLKPGFMQSREVLPPEVMQTLDVMKSEVNALHAEAQSLGINLGTDFDPYAEFFPRFKSNELRQIEAASGITQPSWTRKGFSSLMSTLLSPGGRDMVYKGHKQGTSGMLDLLADPRHQHEIEAIDRLAIDSPNLINGARPKIIPGHIGVRHLEDVAEKLGTNADDLWDQLGLGVTPSRTEAYVTAAAGDQFHIMERGTPVGQIFTNRLSPTEATIGPQLRTSEFDRGVLHDTLPYVEQKLQASGVNRISVQTTPELGDAFWKSQGYRPDTISGDTEKWVKDIYAAAPGVDPKLNAPRMVKVEDALSRLATIRDGLQAQIDAGDLKGEQPGRGWWKRWDDLRDPTGEKTYNFNMDTAGLAKLDPTTLQPGMFRNINDYDLARAQLEKGKEVYYGYRQMQKGKPLESILVAPTAKAKLALIWDRFSSGLRERLTTDPLLRTEATYDHLHSSITRNHGEVIDRWMPELDRMNGTVTASGPLGAVHVDTPNNWRKLMPKMMDQMEKGKPLTGPMQALLRLDDDSLQALSYTAENMDTLKGIRESVEAELGTPIARDVGIPLVDRHRALAEEIGDHVEKRAAPLFSRSAAIAGYDYQTKNGSAVAIVKGVQATLQDMWREGVKEGIAPDIVVKYDPTGRLDMTFGEAIDEDGMAMFAGKVNASTFLENTRQQFIRSKLMKDVDTPELIKNQIEQIKGIRAPSEVFEQMRTLNEIGAAATLPELTSIQQFMSSLGSITKAGQLSWPATAVRDGFSSFVNAVLVGNMNPLTALARHGGDAIAFSRGMPVDPGEGVKEIEAFLSRHGRQSTPTTRGEAFRTMWAAHHQGGSIHPNVFKADEAAMQAADSSSRLMQDLPNVGGKGLFEKLKGEASDVWNTPGKFNPLHPNGPLGTKGPLAPRKVAGAWTTDARGRRVQISESNAWVSTLNAFRTDIDLKNRAMFVLDRLEKTKSLEDAFRESDRVLLNANPRNFTRFEHQYLRTLVPYYSFMRQSIPMFLKELATNPGGRLGATVRATRLGQGDENGYIPYQYQDSTAIPLGANEDGSLKYLTSFGLMHEDAVSYVGNALQRDLRGLLQKGLSSTNPAVKWLIEYGTNTSLFSQGPMGGRRLDDLDPSVGRLLTNIGAYELGPSGRAKPFVGPLVESMAAASPVSRMLSVAKIATEGGERAGAAEKVLRLLTGGRIENVSREQITRDVRDRLNAIQIEHGARPLTTVIGAEGARDEMLLKGDVEGATKMERIVKVLAALRKQEQARKQKD